MISTVKYNSTM